MPTMATAMEYQTTEFALITCCNCGIQFYVPSYWQQKRREDRRSFQCPNGHTQGYYGETEAQKLRKQLDREKETSSYWKRRRNEETQARLAAERRAAAHKGVATKLKKRAANGVCPCCSRTFVNLANHMKSQHPDFVEAASTE